MAIAAITLSLSSPSSAVLRRPHRLSKPLPPLSFSPLSHSHSRICRPLSLSPVFSSLHSQNPLNPENENPQNESPQNPENPENGSPEDSGEDHSENNAGEDSGDADSGDSGDGNDSGDGGVGGGGGGGGGDEGESGGGSKNEKEVLMVLAEKGRALDSLPADLAAAVQEGRIPVDIVRRYLELETSPFFKWLMQFAGFRERLLADDLFLAKVAMECGVGIFTKTAAEYERRRENFFKEIEIVCADVVMAVIADFMLVYLPAPTVALRPPLALNAGAIAKFFHGCPDNAFQIALGGASYSFIQRVGAIVRNGAKLFVVGTTSSLVGTTITNIAINARKAVDKSAADEVENVPILSTSVAYGVYMAISSNLRYQFVAGIAEQRILEPMFHNQKLILSALCFAVRTGNTFLGSLLWVDYARWIGIQKAH